MVDSGRGPLDGFDEAALGELVDELLTEDPSLIPEPDEDRREPVGALDISSATERANRRWNRRWLVAPLGAAAVLLVAMALYFAGDDGDDSLRVATDSETEATATANALAAAPIELVDDGGDDAPNDDGQDAGEPSPAPLVPAADDPTPPAEVTSTAEGRGARPTATPTVLPTPTTQAAQSPPAADEGPGAPDQEPTPVLTPTAAAEPTMTATPSATPWIPAPAATATPTATPSPTSTATPTLTPTPSPTPTPIIVSGADVATLGCTYNAGFEDGLVGIDTPLFRTGETVLSGINLEGASLVELRIRQVETNLYWTASGWKPVAESLSVPIASSWTFSAPALPEGSYCVVARGRNDLNAGTDRGNTIAFTVPANDTPEIVAVSNETNPVNLISSPGNGATVYSTADIRMKLNPGAATFRITREGADVAIDAAVLADLLAGERVVIPLTPGTYILESANDAGLTDTQLLRVL